MLAAVSKSVCVLSLGVMAVTRSGCVYGVAGTEDASGGGAHASSAPTTVGPRGAAGSVAGLDVDQDPCRTGRPPADLDGHVIIGDEHDNVIKGTAGRDLIFGGPGDDTIYGGGGADIICGGPGDDLIFGDMRGPRDDRHDTSHDGNDYIDAGAGRDVVWGNGGDDVIHGGTGGDQLHGNRGNDRIFGDLLDDYLWGDEGDDLLVGGHGIDRMYGDEGDDWLRGDTNRDVMWGGAGTDTVSFMTATPPGQKLSASDVTDFLTGNENRELSGVMPGTERDDGSIAPHPDWGREVRFVPAFTAPLFAPGAGDARGVIVVNGPHVEAVGGMTNQVTNLGVAVGDGGPEELRGVEIVYGSPFDDLLIVGPETQVVFADQGDDTILTAGPTVVHGGGGTDTCTATVCEGCPPTPCALLEDDTPPREGSLYVYLTPSARDLGLVVLGTGGDDHVTIAMNGEDVVVSTDGPAITPGIGCATGAGANEVRCGLAEAELRFLTAFGGAGADHFVLAGGGFPRDFTSTIDGGAGDDVLEGHGGQDILFPGPDGVDHLYGNAGDDALISVGEGPDTMYGGPGNDQLVSNDPCGGHSFYGGAGWDVGGFARVGTSFGNDADRCRERIHARIGARAYQPFYCAPGQGTYLSDSIEVLEGAGGSDVLIGNGRDNVIWGWGGDDIIRGQQGDDIMEGHVGEDWIFGAGGRDRLRGGVGFDHLFAAESTRERDPQVSCGEGGGRIESLDMTDPNAAGCSDPDPAGANAWRDICCDPPAADRDAHPTEWDRVCRASRDEGDMLARD